MCNGAEKEKLLFVFVLAKHLSSLLLFFFVPILSNDVAYFVFALDLALGCICMRLLLKPLRQHEPQMDCIIFFTGVASLIKVFVNLPLILDVFKDKLWLRIAIEQLYWYMTNTCRHTSILN